MISRTRCGVTYYIYWVFLSRCQDRQNIPAPHRLCHYLHNFHFILQTKEKNTKQIIKHRSPILIIDIRSHHPSSSCHHERNERWRYQWQPSNVGSDQRRESDGKSQSNGGCEIAVATNNTTEPPSYDCWRICKNLVTISAEWIDDDARFASIMSDDARNDGCGGDRQCRRVFNVGWIHSCTQVPALASSAACVEELFLSCLDTVMLPNDVIDKK